MIKVRRTKVITSILLISTIMSFLIGCKDKTSFKTEVINKQTEQGTSDSKGKTSEALKEKLDTWEFSVPTGFKLEENGGPWYEKRYSNEKGIALLFGYYAPNGIDNRTDKEVFEDTVKDIEENLINRYGIGEITYKDINSEKMCFTTYFETRDLKVLERSIMNAKVWNTISIEVPIRENEKDYEKILDIIESK